MRVIKLESVFPLILLRRALPRRAMSLPMRSASAAASSTRPAFTSATNQHTQQHEASRGLSAIAELLVKTIMVSLHRGRFVVVHLYWPLYSTWRAIYGYGHSWLYLNSYFMNKWWYLSGLYESVVPCNVLYGALAKGSVVRISDDVEWRSWI